MDTRAKVALSPTERINWLRLIRSENVGPITFRHLIAHFGSAGDAIDGLPELSRRGGRAKPVRVAAKAEAEDEIARLEKLGGRFVALGEPDYSVPLATTEDAPPMLAVIGDVSLLRRETVGVVGARNASTNGRRIAQQIAGGLGATGFVVASGFARGIDASAHGAALETGTVAAIAGGVDVVYPRENEMLYRAIAEKGAHISEQPLGTQPTARHFPRRNRLISGLSLGVLVVEAAQRSGSLITARFALEQGRDVFAVPGSPLDPRCLGSNNLIRQGAVLTESAADITEALSGQIGAGLRHPEDDNFLTKSIVKSDSAGLEAARAKVLEALGPAPTSVDEIIRQCQLSAPVVAAALLELELAGRLERHPGHRVALIFD
ncbi:MAG: DNA-processing protein DprA [Alphaproteobacteria bacterium]